MAVIVFVHGSVNTITRWQQCSRQKFEVSDRCWLLWLSVQREHNDMLLKLEFVRDLSASIIQIARSRSSPLAESVFVDDVAMCPAAGPMSSDTGSSTVFIGEGQRTLEQIVLYMRALELLASALNLAKAALADGRLSPTMLTRQGTIFALSFQRHCSPCVEQLAINCPFRSFTRNFQTTPEN